MRSTLHPAVHGDGVVPRRAFEVARGVVGHVLIGAGIDDERAAEGVQVEAQLVFVAVTGADGAAVEDQVGGVPIPPGAHDCVTGVGEVVGGERRGLPLLPGGGHIDQVLPP